MNKFDTIYIVEPVKNFSAVVPYCTQIRFLTTGKETIAELGKVITSNIQDFDPDKDALIAVGRSNAVMLTGMILTNMLGSRQIWVGIYQSRMSEEGKVYEWIKV